MATPQQILDLPLRENDAGAATVREYLVRLLGAVWEEGEGFSGKRPFGNSSWEYDLYTALATAGFVVVELDEDGYIDRFDNSERRKADAMIAGAIDALGRAS